jgi:Family of unknown function (DUF6225)
MDFSGIEYAFEGEPWTVGRLRQALEHLADDTPVVVLAEFEPGVADTYVIVDGSLLSEAVVERCRLENDELVLLCTMRDDGEEEE